MVTMVISKTQAKEIAHDLPSAKLAEIMKLRKKGYSNYDISEMLELPYPHVVAEAIKKAMSHEYSDPKKLKRRLEEARLEDLYQKAYEAFIAQGNTEWFDRLLNTSARKAKLLGLDAPVEQVLTGKNGGPVQIAAIDFKGLSDEELAQMKALAMKAAG